jgi:hypothetical protein
MLEDAIQALNRLEMSFGVSLGTLMTQAVSSSPITVQLCYTLAVT